MLVWGRVRDAVFASASVGATKHQHGPRRHRFNLAGLVASALPVPIFNARIHHAREILQISGSHKRSKAVSARMYIRLTPGWSQRKLCNEMTAKLKLETSKPLPDKRVRKELASAEYRQHGDVH